MLTDEVKIRISAGRGGDGAVAFDKVKMSLGPTGGRGGNGGSVYFSGTTNLSALNKFKNQKEFWAGDGKKGKTDRGDGPGGKDITLVVPVGSRIRKIETGETIDILEAEKPVLLAKGGIGGRGNFFFRSSKNTTPKEFEEGKSGESFELEIELCLIAKVGLIGLPSAGKSSLLNELTKTQVKVGAYHFTTLEPNLGDLEGVIIADIPGLIEGASEGKGLGVRFLRHIQRTEVLFHCLSLESEDLEKDYQTVRAELEKYNPEITKKKEVIILTKSDVADESKKKKALVWAKEKNLPIRTVSIHNFDEISELKKFILENFA